MWFWKKKQFQPFDDVISGIVESILYKKGLASGEALNEVFDKIADLQHQSNCGAVCGHEPRRFVKINPGRFLSRTLYVFECQQCALHIKKTRDQLTQTERDALIGLGHDNLREQPEEKE